jgi:hypothetical protein
LLLQTTQKEVAEGSVRRSLLSLRPAAAGAGGADAKTGGGGGCPPWPEDSVGVVFVRERMEVTYRGGAVLVELRSSVAHAAPHGAPAHC